MSEYDGYPLPYEVTEFLRSLEEMWGAGHEVKPDASYDEDVTWASMLKHIIDQDDAAQGE